MSAEVQRVRFRPNGPFHAELKRRTDAFFEGSGRSRHGGWRMGLKTAIILAWLAASWCLLVLGPVGPWLAVPLTISLALAIAAVGFGVQHDANHGGTSASPRVNRAMAYALDLVGASSYLWRHKHNVMHHTYTNVAGLDFDIESGNPFLRFAPWLALRPWHRFQHLYAPLLYAVFPLRWWLGDDLQELATGRMAGRPFPRPRGWDLAGALIGKVIFVGYLFVVPAVLHPTWWLLPLYALGLLVLGNVLALTFQMAHCQGEAEFREADAGVVESEWAAHQVATTVDFAPKSRLLSWYMGGLNFQVEHHLFPRVCHLHYADLSRIVAETCAAQGLRYRAEPRLRDALGAHFRWLRAQGRAGRAAPAPLAHAA